MLVHTHIYSHSHSAYQRTPRLMPKLVNCTHAAAAAGTAPCAPARPPLASPPRNPQQRQHPGHGGAQGGGIPAPVQSRLSHSLARPCLLPRPS